LTELPFFQYKAVTPSGEVQEGVLEASGTSAAIARLQEMGLIPIRAEEAGAAKAAAPARAPLFTRNRITQTDIGVVTRELATLLKAGLPLDRPRRLPSCSARYATRSAAARPSPGRSTGNAAPSRAST
jgi:type II secretory pathway component PulF